MNKHHGVRLELRIVAFFAAKQIKVEPIEQFQAGVLLRLSEAAGRDTHTRTFHDA